MIGASEPTACTSSRELASRRHGQPHMSPRPAEAIPADFDGICEGWNTGELCRPTESFGTSATPESVRRSDRWPDSSLATTRA